MEVHILRRVNDPQLFFRTGGPQKILVIMSIQKNSQDDAAIWRTRYVKGFGLLFRTRTHSMIGPSSGVHRTDTHFQIATGLARQQPCFLSI